jgi:GWxTD domain-containing protein
MREGLEGDENRKSAYFNMRDKSMHKSEKLLVIGIFLAFIFSPLVKALPQEGLDLWLNYACFQYQPDATKSYVEIYYALERSQLDFFPQEGDYLATVLSLGLLIQDLKGDTVEFRRWEVASTVKSLEEKRRSYMIIDALGTVLSPGDYFLKLTVEDLNSKRRGMSEIELEVPDFFEKDLTLSQIELAYSMEPETLATKFTKGARKVMPNPSGLFTQKGQMLYFYAEAYNLVFRDTLEDEYSLSFEVLDKNDEKFKNFGTQTLKKPGGSAIIMSGINITTLPKGDFKLRITVADPLSSEVAQTTKDFKIWREEITPEEGVLGSLQDEEEVEKVKKEIRYIATRAELKMWDELNLEGKGEFLEDFWRKRDPDPTTPENEFKIEHYRRWNFVNAKFSRYQETNDGWQTDMGRIYVKYGEPDDIERHPYSLDNKPWEKWHYDEIEENFTCPRQSGVIFVFADEDGFGVYRLIHSTAVGEIQNLRWYDSIKSETDFDR